MPCGHTEAEFALFSKAERRILRMIFELNLDREAIKIAMEIADSTLREHMAHIKRKQALMRLARANLSTAEQQQRQRDKWLPEVDPFAPAETEEEKERPSIRQTSREETAPIDKVTTVPPPRMKAVFVAVPQKMSRAKGGFKGIF